MADGSDELYNQTIPNGRVDYVREEYKHYKRKKPPPDFSEVIDLQDSSTFRGHVEKFELNKSAHSKFGLRCVTEWRAYELNSCPGFMFIVNPFLPGAQHYWTRRCMEDFPRKPNVCNLDAHMTLDPSKSVWEVSHSNDEKCDLMDRLRWVHLGYHFDYNVVDYKPERYYDFPSDLAGMTQHIANAIGYPEYSPEAGIVNYYPLGGSMGGHTDHYESDLSWPLISLSFGQTAIFLIGGATRDVRPVALYVRSGDIIIMSGKSRTAFHAVPRIIKVGNENEPPSCLKWKDLLFANDVDMTSVANPDEAIVPDMNVEIPDVLEETSIVSHRTCGSSKEQSEKALCQESCDNEISSEFGNQQDK
ncbi:Nucleic acid dioxygenase alkbh1 [Desmophyllum pertusum]|uniref:Nucleic acid dioxygenase alkbh1 n=1 Tax=Desmophyllum pertusum TaxID=174260 RepID=A0A9X0D8U2_9CNID|nr:Nucleic acid dioxygenase alkbh1 [Desmophyllum pertusum]